MLANFLSEERIQLPCWIPVFIAIGILIGFNTPPINFLYLTAALASLLIFAFFCPILTLRMFLIASSSILIGLLAITLRIKTVDSPIVPFDDQFSIVKGRIDNITPLDHGHRVLMSNLKIRNLKKEETPERIRLTFRTKLNDAKIGDRAKVMAILSKPKQPYLPNSYNFARDAYFKKIGAVGHSVSEFTVLYEDKKSIIGKLNTLRNNIQTRVNQAIGSYNGSIATALMLNEYSNIDKKVLQNLRATGLAHILSVSGMHLSLVAAIFFFSSRLLLNCCEPIALRVHCKKIAATISLFGSLAYLLISGMEVAAVRSFIMTSMIIISIILDRTSNPMRAIALAATIILIISPENIIHPSFQMSFGAVIALVSCYEFFTKLKFNFSEFNFIQKILFYLLSLSFSSLVAGLATTPFALYHFSQSSNYSILANLLAVPITSFWLMPCVVLSFLLYPFNLEFLSLYPMQYGITLMLNIADYVANLPHSVSVFAKLNDSNILIITLGMLWFCIWKTRIRLLGILIIALGILLQSFVTKPNIFIDWESKKIAVLDDNNRLIFLTKQLAKFKKKLLMNQLGTSEAMRYPKGASNNLYCQKEQCVFVKEPYKVDIDTSTMTIKITKDDEEQSVIHKTHGTEFIYLN